MSPDWSWISRPGAVLRATRKRFAAPGHPAREAAQKQECRGKPDQRERRERRREEGREQELDRKEDGSHRKVEQMRKAKQGAGDVVEEQRLHPGLPDPARLVPSCLRQGRSGAQLKRGLVGPLKARSKPFAPDEEERPERHCHKEQGRGR